MKHILTLTVSIAIVAVALLQAAAQGTAFTYQGRLNDGGAPATGTYDLQFALFSVSSGGSAVAGPVTNSAVAVSNGLFSVVLDFGNPPFSTGSPRWLELGARTNGGGAFVTLAPRQQLTATPYAITAGNVTGTLPNAGLSGTYTTPVVLSNAANAFSGSGAGLTLVNAASLGGLSAGQFWQLGGNNVSAIQFLGSTNNRTLELRANNQAVLRLVPNPGNPPNVIAGSGNVIASGAFGSVIGGGDGHSIDVNATNSTIAGGSDNNIQANSIYSTISGGTGNRVFGSVEAGTISGGEGNFIRTGASDATIGGGTGHTIQSNALSATISGGGINSIGVGSRGGAIGGGSQNEISDFTTNATLAGGVLNTVSSDYSTLGGGSLNTIFSGAPDATIAGGDENQIQPGASGSSIGGGQSNTVGTNSSLATIAGGTLNKVLVGSAFGVIGGGEQNTISNGAYGALIAGGEFNAIQSNAPLATISGGDHNTIQTSCYNSVIGGGGANVISNLAVYSTIPGGSQNLIAGQYSFAAGRVAQALNSGCFVWSSSAAGTPTTSVLDQSVTFRAPNGYRFFTASTGTTTGAQLPANGTAWSSLSDRNAKKNIKPVDCQGVLDKLSHVPVEQWNYNWEDNGAVPHLGPMAQDFKGAFYPGRDDKMISTLEFDGVELAAIEGLNQKLEKELKEKEARVSELETRLDRLEKMVLDSKRN